MKFYRYEAYETPIMDVNGKYCVSKIPNPKIRLIVLYLYKETSKGYWICEDNSTMFPEKWVSKTSVKKYAYPTKEEAKLNFVKRTEKRMNILLREASFCQISIFNIEHEK